MGCNFKKFRGMSSAQSSKYRRNVIRLHRSLAITHLVGMCCVCLFIVGLALHHLITN